MKNNSSSGRGKSNSQGGYKKDTRGGKAGGFKRQDGEDRPKRSFSKDDKPFDRPKRSFSKDDRFKKDGEDRPKRSFSRDDRSGDDRPKRSFSRDDKPFDKPKRSFGKDDRFKKDGDDRPKRSFSRDDRSGDDRPKRSFSRDDKPFDKSKRPFKKDDRFKKDGEDRPKRSFSRDDRSGDERPKRSFSRDDRSGDDRPKRSFSKDDKPKRSFDKGDKFKDAKSDKPKRFSERNVFKEDKPERPVEDYEKNFVTPKEFEKSLKEDKKPVIMKGKRDASFDKPFPLGSKKVSGPFRKKEAEEKLAAKQKPATKRKRIVEDEDDFEDDAEDQVTEVKEMTLNKYIAHSGQCSRREAAELVKQGKVKVNGELALDPGYRVQEFDKVTIAGKKLTPQKDRVYILLNKPKGFITTTDDPEGRDTVMDLVASAGIDRLFPVGRLDRNTTGLLLLTNDGDLAQKLSHPSYETKKVYQATLDKPLAKADFEKIVAGLELEDGEVKVDAISYLDEKNEIGLEIHSGRNRIVRRIFESLGYEVEKLDRVMYAGLTKKNLPRSKWRFLDEREIILLKHFKS